MGPINMKVFIRYVKARMKVKNKEMIYRTYVTDALKIIGENTAKYVGGNYITQRWVDITAPKEYSTLTGAEIAANVIRNAGLKVVSTVESV